jgi:uncharacterized membrane protein
MRMETRAKEVRIHRGSRQGAFDRFAEAVSRFVSRGAFFTIALLAVLVWMPTIFAFESVDTWQLVINTLTSVLAFLLIALRTPSAATTRRSTTRSTPSPPASPT